MANTYLPSNKNPSFSSFFSSMQDSRRTSNGNFIYTMDEILFLSISAVISGSDTWVSITEFGRIKLEWLRKFFPYKNGIPSHDVLGKFFQRLDPSTFSNCFIAWIDSISKLSEGEIICIDGKTIRGSGARGGKSALHVVSAFAAENRLCLGQKAVEGKSNEITAIPLLLDLITIKGSIVTIDAMGCQKSIAKSIIEKQADYVLMVKGNQKELKEQVESLFKSTSIKESSSEDDFGHGRIEHRKCEIITDLKYLDCKKDWTGIKSVAKIYSKRIDKQTGKESQETRYYISSLNAKARKIASAVRSHWSIENLLHWNLDVIFKEDSSLKKCGDSALNYNIIAKIALTIIDKEKSTKKSKPIKRQWAALDDHYREFLLNV